MAATVTAATVDMNVDEKEEAESMVVVPVSVGTSTPIDGGGIDDDDRCGSDGSGRAGDDHGDDDTTGFVSEDLQAAFQKAQNVLDRHASTIDEKQHRHHHKFGCCQNHNLGPEDSETSSSSSSSSTTTTTTTTATDEQETSDDDEHDHDSVGLSELWEQLAQVHEIDVVLSSSFAFVDDESGKRNACGSDGRQKDGVISPATGTISGCCTDTTSSRSPSTTAAVAATADTAAVVMDMDVPYTLYDHYTYLEMSQPFNGRLGFVVSSSRTAVISDDSTTTANDTAIISSISSDSDRFSMIPTMFELCQPVSNGTLNSVFFGLQPLLTTTATIPTKGSANDSWSSEERTPFRTVLISKIRPDANCGEIMNDILNAITQKEEEKQIETDDASVGSTAVHLLKRQSGHLCAVIVSSSSRVMPENEDGCNSDATRKACCYDDGEMSSFVFDAQLCVEREDPYQRCLCIRLYHPMEEEIQEAKESSTPSLVDNGDLLSIRPIDRHKNDDRLLWESTALVKLIRAREVVTATGRKNCNNQEKMLITNVVWQDSSFPTPQSVSSPKAATAFLRTSMSVSGRGSSRSTRPSLFSLSYQNIREKTQQKAKAGRANAAFPALMDQTFQLIKTSSAVLINGIIATLNTKKYSFCDRGSKLDDHFCHQIMMMTKESFLIDGGRNKLINALQKKLLTVQERNSEFVAMLLAQVASLDDEACTLTQGRTSMTHLAEFVGFENVIECPPMRFESEHQSYHELCTVTNQRYVEICCQNQKDSYEVYIKNAIKQLNYEEEIAMTICKDFMKISSLSSVATRQATDLAREIGYDENSPPIIFFEFDVDNGKCFVVQDRFIFVESRRSLIWKKKVSTSSFDDVDHGDGNSLKIMNSKGQLLHLRVGPTHKAADIINFIHTMNHLVSRTSLDRV